jgi:peptide/nickel transport system permease protein
MSSDELANPMPAPSADYAAAEEPLEAPRSYVRQVLAYTFSSWRAKLGALWIAILAVCAVFSPFIASSFPLLMKANGRWSSPVLRSLTAVDVILLVMTFVIGAALLARGISPRRKMLLILAALALCVPLSLVFVNPLQTIVYERYRQMRQQGQMEYLLSAPIPYSPSDRQRDLLDAGDQPPGRQHLFGTEVNGADVLSRMIHASRIALAIGFISTGIAVVIGVIIGGLMGYFAGRVDILGMRIIEIFEAIPTLFLLITFVAFFGRNLYLMMAIIGMTTWSGDARFIRAEFLRLRKQDFVQAAVAAGLPLRSILFRHMLPNGIAPVLVSASFGVASAILYEATLSFLGLGLVDQPSWGQLLEQARSTGGAFTWWIAIFPGLAIFLTVFAYNMVGESLRDAIDPHL